MFKTRFPPPTSVLIHECEFCRHFFWQQNFCWHFWVFLGFLLVNGNFRGSFSKQISKYGRKLSTIPSFSFFKWMSLAYMFSWVLWFYIVVERDGEADCTVLSVSFLMLQVWHFWSLVSSVLELRLSLDSLLSNNSGEVTLLWFPQWRLSYVHWPFIVMQCVQTMF